MGLKLTRLPQTLQVSAGKTISTFSLSVCKVLLTPRIWGTPSPRDVGAAGSTSQLAAGPGLAARVSGQSPSLRTLPGADPTVPGSLFSGPKLCPVSCLRPQPQSPDSVQSGLHALSWELREKPACAPLSVTSQPPALTEAPRPILLDPASVSPS